MAIEAQKSELITEVRRGTREVYDVFRKVVTLKEQWDILKDEIIDYDCVGANDGILKEDITAVMDTFYNAAAPIFEAHKASLIQLKS